MIQLFCWHHTFTPPKFNAPERRSPTRRVSYSSGARLCEPQDHPILPLHANILRRPANAPASWTAVALYRFPTANPLPPHLQKILTLQSPNNRSSRRESALTKRLAFDRTEIQILKFPPNMDGNNRRDTAFLPTHPGNRISSPGRFLIPTNVMAICAKSLGSKCLAAASRKSCHPLWHRLIVSFTLASL
jgi:hypothetical protein